MSEDPRAPTAGDTIPGEIPFSELSAACAGDGIDALAVINPPRELPAEDFERMLSDGVGDMVWLERQREMRHHPLSLQPDAIRLLCVSLAYQPAAGEPTDRTSLRRARYAAGVDYHRLLRRKLARIGDALARRHHATWSWRAMVDSAPINERQLARLAGLGWIGRNALLISPHTGSYRFLGMVLTAAPLALHHAGLSSDRCGSCRACERRCPTAALVDRRVVSERCISYLTIEQQGVIPRALASRFEGWWFGCDLCQEACPWNRFAAAPGDVRLSSDGEGAAVGRAGEGRFSEAQLLLVNAATFDAVFAGRVIRRLGFARYRRNLVVALWSLGRLAPAQALVEASRDLPLVLAQAEALGMAPRTDTPAPSAG